MKKWYEQSGPDNDVVISTRIRLARNLRDLPFEDRMSEKQQSELAETVKRVLENADSGNTAFDYILLSKLDDLELLSLAERHLVSRGFIEHPQGRMLAISPDASQSVMIGEEDHLRIQVIESGFSLEEAYARASALDDVFDAALDYAFDEKLGYLTVCPTNLGTGLRASVMLHLPALEQRGMMEQIIKTVSRLGLIIRGSYGEGSGVVGASYQLSNQITLGLSEETAIANLKNVTAQIIESERAARKELLQNNIGAIDAICRSYGILRHARLLPAEEFYTHLSNLRLGIGENIIEHIPMETVNRLQNTSGTATICLESNQRLDSTERDFNRAKMVRAALKQ